MVFIECPFLLGMIANKGGMALYGPPNYINIYLMQCRKDRGQKSAALPHPKCTGSCRRYPGRRIKGEVKAVNLPRIPDMPANKIY